MKWLKTYTLYKETKLFESNSEEVSKELIESLLFDFSDIDIPVEVEFYKPDPLGSSEDRVLILIGNEDNMDQSKDLPLYENLNSFISLNEYLIDDGYQLKSIACWIKTTNDSVNGQRPITITEFDNFINKIEEVERWNNKPSAIPHIFKLVDICYTKN